MVDSNRDSDASGSGWAGEFDADWKWGQQVHGDVRARHPENQDAFDNLVVRNTQNELDIGSHYNFNLERLRFLENGTLINDPDADSTRFDDLENNYRLSPQAGDDLFLYTAQRSRYLIGFDAQASMALQLETALGTGDRVEFGLNDLQTPVNKAFFEFTDSGQRCVLTKSGSENVETSFELPDGVTQTTPLRPEIKFNAYGIGRYEFILSYTDSTEPIGEKQKNVTVAELVDDEGFTTNDYNYHLYYEIDAANPDLTLLCGSFSYITNGGAFPSSRTKVTRVVGTANNYTGGGEYEPILAVRIDADRGNVFTTFESVQAVPDGGDGELLVVVVSDDQTDATGFSTPPQHNPLNSVIEQTTNVTTFPDQDGNIVTTATNPGGYQVGFFASDAVSTSANSGRATESVVNPRPLFEDDVAIFLYKGDSTQDRTVNTVYANQMLF